MVRESQSRVADFDEPPASAPRSEVPQESLMLVIWRRRWIVVLAVALCLAGAVAYLLKATPIYVASSRLYIEQAGARLLSDKMGATPNSDSYLYTQVEVMQSTPVLAKAADSAGARRMRTFEGSDNIVAAVKEALSVEVGKKDDIVTLSVQSPSPEEAALLANSLVDSYISYHTEHSKSTAAEVLKILQKEKEKRDAELKSKMQAQMELRKANPAIVADYDKGNLVVQRCLKLYDALVTAQMETMDAKANLECTRIIVRNPNQLKELVRAQRAVKGTWYENDRTDNESSLARLELELVLTRQKGYGADHTNLQTLETAVQKMREAVTAERESFAKAYLESAEQACEAAKLKEADLQKSFEQTQKDALDLNMKVAEYTMLDNEVKRAEKLSDILDDRIKELSVTEDAGALNISILEVARAPEKPAKPQKSRILAMALVLGLMMGTGLALLRDWTDQRLRSAEEITAVLDVPVLGVVPHMSGHGAPPERGKAVHLEPMSNISEAYRTVRTAIYFGMPAGKAKTLLVTSPAPGDGKSTSASNLAVAIAQAGQRVLIVDCDFRKPMQHRIFEIKDDVGLSSVLAGRSTLVKAVRPSGIPSLDVLPCGPIPPNPSEMLNSQAFTDAIKQFAEEYDHVIIDSPPVMAVADARILGALADVTILVLRAEKSTRKLSELARDGLLSVGARILGVVVNDAASKRGQYGYYGDYGYHGHGRRYAREGENGNGKGKAAAKQAEEV